MQEGHAATVLRPAHDSGVVHGRRRIVRGTPDGRGMTFLDDRSGIPNLWILPFDGGPAKQLTHFPKSEIHGFVWSPDGKRIALSRGAMEQNVVLIKTGPSRQP